MGRPLKASVLEEMNLKAIMADKESEEEGATKTVTLGKQVGYNKYIVGENREIARLTTELVFDYDAILKLRHGDKEEFVLKITNNVFQTETCVHAYELENGKVKFLEDDVELLNQ